MVSADPLRKLRDLDRSSPHFHEHLNDILRDDEYRNSLSNLQSEDLRWLVEYLDTVSLWVILFRYALTGGRLLWVSPIAQESLSRNRSVNSGGYVVPGECCRNRAHYRSPSWNVCMRGRLMVRGCALDA
jgi:hypothetical protein